MLRYVSSQSKYAYINDGGTVKSRKWRVIATFVTTAMLGGAAAACSDSDEAPQYRPTAAESEMFTHLLPATSDQAAQADDALGSLRYDWHDDGDYDVYTAESDFHSVYTAHPMVILMAPGVKWLGGSLGQITMVFRVTDDQYRNHWVQGADTLKRIQEYGWANVVYDPLCRAYTYGFATLDACESSPEQRQAVTAGEQRLKPIEVLAYDTYRVELNPRYSVIDWTAPSGNTTALLPSAPASRDNKAVIPVTVLGEGQQLTGGELGERLVLLPVTRRTYFNDEDFKEYPVVIEDPLAGEACDDGNGIPSYLGQEVLEKYCPAA